jgi:hypothetical protein
MGNSIQREENYISRRQSFSKNSASEHKYINIFGCQAEDGFQKFCFRTQTPKYFWLSGSMSRNWLLLTMVMNIRKQNSAPFHKHSAGSIFMGKLSEFVGYGLLLERDAL